MDTPYIDNALLKARIATRHISRQTVEEYEREGGEITKCERGDRGFPVDYKFNPLSYKNYNIAPKKTNVYCSCGAVAIYTNKKLCGKCYQVEYRKKTKLKAQAEAVKI